jgi:hypothetical protein
MVMRRFLQSLLLSAAFVGFGSPAAAQSGRLVVAPESIELTRVGETHRVLVGRVEGGAWVGDLTGAAEFVTSNPSVATVDAEGRVRAVADGRAQAIATVGEERATAEIIVSGTGRPADVSFMNDVLPVLYRMGCSTGACHGAAAGKNGFKLSLRGFDPAADRAMLTRAAAGRRVSVAEPKNSLMLLKPTMAVPHEGGQRFEVGSEPYTIFLNWIEAGAPGPDGEEPEVARLEVLPADATLEPGAVQPIVVIAHYADGSRREVTRWALLETTDDAVLTVDEGGAARVETPGAASVTAWFAGKVAAARFSSPRPGDVKREAFDRARRANFIDDLVLDRLKRLNVPPAGEASDLEFLRRAYLDATGALPRPDEVLDFALDPDPDKRARLIDDLLESPEFVDRWSYRWSDLLLVSSRTLPNRSELLAMSRYVRRSVETNAPWNKFVRDILTARGDTLDNGAANYYLIHKNPIERAEATTKTFMGLSLTCARCHNHPLEKWTQNDYYGFANLFSRVELKSGRMGGTIVMDGEMGDLAHPRLGRPLDPKPLDAAPLDPETDGERRARLAEWLTAPENPYFTRAIVNRVWKQFMGRGLVEPADDLRLTNPASNEPLMQTLCDEFVANEYDLKHLMRRIMNSATYQRSSRPVDSAAPDNIHYSQYIVRRLPAEVILDAYSQVTGVPTNFAFYPEGTRALQLPDTLVVSYFLDAFGRPEREDPHAEERDDEATLAQALHLVNGDTLNNKLRDERSFLTALLSEFKDDAIALEEIYLRALSRRPTAEERARALVALDWLNEVDSRARREAFEDLAWAVMTSDEFLFNR